jgi:uncharacterized repeat protein (TIGR03806 family)
VTLAGGARSMRLLALVTVLSLLFGCSRGPASPVFHESTDPETLAEWGLFAIEDGRLVPRDGVVDYELNTPLFSDYAHKLRTVWMPPGTRANYLSEGAFEFPIGTLVTKTFYYPLVAEGHQGQVLRTSETRGLETGGRLVLDQVRLIETRLLVRRASGWVASTYVWDDAQRDARLERTGAVRTLRLVSETGQAAGRDQVDFDYVVPDVNQCAGCHATDVKRGTLSPIGLKARHLNREHDYGLVSGRTNQLEYWVRSGRLNLPDGGFVKPAALPRAAVWDDAKAPIETRARAYLDINCGHCHNRLGPADTSGLSLDASETSAVAFGVCKSPIAAGRGTGNRRFSIVPGRPDESITLYRMASTDPGAMMPELGRALAHDEGVELIRRWIAEWPDARGCDQVTSNSARHSASAARLSRSQG